MMFFSKYSVKPYWLSVFALMAACATASGADELLTIGSDAPAIDVEHWVQDGKGKFKPVTEFAKGKVYVVEFWATWCGPCIMSMPHIVELQNKYAAKGVQVVSISDEDLATVEKFLERDVQSAKNEEKKSEDKKSEDKPQTYKDLTSAYCLTTDPDRSVHTAYMEAAVQGGIPTAFIVGKDQKIEWIGHPMSMDEPLSEIVAGTWDRQKFADEFKPRQELDQLVSKIGAAMNKGDTKGALALIEEALGKAKQPEIKDRLSLYRLQIQLNDKDSQEQLPAIIEEAYKAYADDARLINMIAMTVAQKTERGLLNSEAALKSTRAAIEKAVKAAEGETRVMLLNTASHVQFVAGDIDAAIKSQSEAVELASPRLKPQLQPYLEKLKQEKEAKADPK